MRHGPQLRLRRSRSVQILFDKKALEGVGRDIQVEDMALRLTSSLQNIRVKRSRGREGFASSWHLRYQKEMYEIPRQCE